MTLQARVLFAGAGPSQMVAIRHAQSLGYECYAVDADPGAIGFEFANGFDVGDICDPKFLLACAQRFNVNAIVAIATDVAVPSVARACASLGLPSIPVEAADISVNKLLQRKRMHAAGLVVPAFMPFQTENEAIANSAIIGFPVVIKPTDGAGSRGVCLVRDASEVIQAAKVALAVSRTKVALVEEYIEGVEVSVEGFVINGRFHNICISEKTRTPPPYLLDMAVHFPDTLSQSEHSEIIEVAGKAVSACGLNNCPVHMELLRANRGPVVVELAARGAGFQVFTNILPHVTGIDTVNIQLRLALGETIEISPQEPLKGAAIIFLSPTPGRLKAFKGLEEASRVKGVQEAKLYIKVDAVMEELKCGADRIGHLIVFAENRREAERQAHLALSLIKLEVH